MSSTAASSSTTRQRSAPSLVDIVKPPRCPNMTTLDRSVFTVRHPILSVKVPVNKLGRLNNHPLIQKYLIDMPKVRHIISDPEDTSYKLLRTRVQSEEQLSSATRELIASECKGLVEDMLEVDYDMWTASEILNSILPNTEEEFAPSSFTQTGHIGHFNLRPEWLPYKHLIGHVYLDKNPQLRTVVNKLDNIHAEFRYFDMEVLAGEQDLVTTASESNCLFTFDFSKVYWNSRLQREHDRLVASINSGEVVADVMAGVGPFVIPAAKKGCFALGNDLNPEGVKWMKENRVANKVEKTLRVTELDGKQFIRQSARMVWDNPFPPYTPPSVKRKMDKEARRNRLATAVDPSFQSLEQLCLSNLNLASNSPDRSNSVIPSVNALSSSSSVTAPTQETQNQTTLQPQLVQHYIMNLPDSALTFLDAFVGVFTPLLSEPMFEERLEKIGLPMVHVYCFSRELELAAAVIDICERASSYLGHKITPSTDSYNLHLVRRVAPQKDMYCLSFRLPREVALAPRPE